MPQMMPMFWLLMLMFMTILLILLIINMYFLFFNLNFFPSTNPLILYKWNWKW